MTEQQVVKIVQADASLHTDFGDPYWAGIDPIVLQQCFDKGFICWNGRNKLIVTPLGKRSCGGTNHERHH